MLAELKDLVDKNIFTLVSSCVNLSLVYITSTKHKERDKIYRKETNGVWSCLGTTNRKKIRLSALCRIWDGPWTAQTETCRTTKSVLHFICAIIFSPRCRNPAYADDYLRLCSCATAVSYLWTGLEALQSRCRALDTVRRSGKTRRRKNTCRQNNR